VALQETTQIKILGSTTVVMCEVMNCEKLSRFLFRTGAAGRIEAYCADHAASRAKALGIKLPDPEKHSVHSIPLDRPQI
jgi:hypothetical protein